MIYCTANVSNEVHSIVMQQITYYMAPRAHMPNTGTVVT